MLSPRHARRCFPQTWRGLTPLALAAALLAGCNRLEPTKNQTAGTTPIAGAIPDHPSTAGEGDQIPTPTEGSSSPDSIPDADSAGPLVIPKDPSQDMQITYLPPSGSSATDAMPLGDENAQELSQRSFATLVPNPTNQPDELLEHLGEIDAALRELVVVGSRSLIDEETFIEGGMRLGKMKLAAAKRLANLETATQQQRKSGQVATLVALSHLSGLQDVESAQELNRFADELSKMSDPDLAHQGRVVLLGFEVQALQNGQKSDPSDLLAGCGLLLDDPNRRNFPEFIAVQNAADVLSRMGFDTEAQQAINLLATAYEQSPDNNLRGQAWLFAIGNSSTAQAYFQALDAQLRGSGSSADFLATARGLLAEFPQGATVEKLASALGELDSRKADAASQQLAEIIREAVDGAHLTELQASGISQLLRAHDARQAIVGQPLDLGALVTFEGKPFSLSETKGKVVLVEFWASWCMYCIGEIPYLRKNYDLYHGQGLEIIGVNMDTELDKGKQFVEQQAFPWANVHPSDLAALGFEAEFAQRLGISQIPFSILVDRDGNVAEIHVRGDDMGPAVQRLLANE